MYEISLALVTWGVVVILTTADITTSAIYTTQHKQTIYNQTYAKQHLCMHACMQIIKIKYFHKWFWVQNKYRDTVTQNKVSGRGRTIFLQKK